MEGSERSPEAPRTIQTQSLAGEISPVRRERRVSGALDRRLSINIHRSDVKLVLVERRNLTRLSLVDMLKRGIQLSDVFPFPDLDSLGAFDFGTVAHGGVDLALLSIGMESVHAPAVATEIDRLKEALPGTFIVIFSDREREERLLDAFVRHGLRGYITSSLDPKVVIAAIQLVLAGGVYIPDTLMGSEETMNETEWNLLDPAVEEVCKALTPRQREVMHLLGQGKSNKYIAFELHIRECTVKAHVRQIMKKLGVTNRTEAACRVMAASAQGLNC